MLPSGSYSDEHVSASLLQEQESPRHEPGDEVYGLLLLKFCNDKLISQMCKVEFGQVFDLVVS